MTKDDARAFIVALNNITAYVPPMHMQPLITNPICKIIEQMANAPEQLQQSEPAPAERPKPHIVENSG